jgi:hypothetical protein
MAKAAHSYVELARGECGILANVPKVHTHQDAAAAGTAFDAAPHMHLFPRHPRPEETDHPETDVMPVTRGGFKIAGCWIGPSDDCRKHVDKLVSKLDIPLARLVDSRLRAALQTRWQTFRNCYRAQATLTHPPRERESDNLPTQPRRSSPPSTTSAPTSCSGTRSSAP